MAHPIAEQVVPHLARRSYSLATFFGLAALWQLAVVAARPLRHPDRWRILLVLL